MALITCPECKKKISENAESCPKCGYRLSAQKIAEIKKKTAKTQAGCLIAFLSFFAILLIFNLFSSDEPSHKSNRPKTADEIRRERIDRQFSAWDGSHRKLTALIKSTMNDPGSYEHVKTIYWDKGNYLIVKTTFRGKNAFGGVVTNWISAKVDLDGNILNIISQGP